MANWIADCRHFTVALVLLNLSDLLWCVYEPRVLPLGFQIWLVSRKWGRCRDFTIAADSFRDYAPRTWMRSNLVAALVLTLGLLLAPDGCTIIGASVCLVGVVNTVMDVKKTHLRVP